MQRCAYQVLPPFLFALLMRCFVARTHSSRTLLRRPRPRFTLPYRRANWRRRHRASHSPHLSPLMDRTRPPARSSKATSPRALRRDPPTAARDGMPTSERARPHDITVPRRGPTASTLALRERRGEGRRMGLDGPCAVLCAVPYSMAVATFTTHVARRRMESSER